MARPRSLVGLLVHLLVLHVRRQPALLAIVLVPLVAIVLVSRGRTTDHTVASTQVMPPLQAGVLKDGFLIMEAVGDRHVVELDRNGVRRRRSAIPTVTETRAFGGPRGAGVAWIQSKKVRVAWIKGDGKLGNPEIFGSSVRTMCDGLASNDQRWAVGWLEERDDRLWFVHGPTAKATAEVTALDMPVALDRAAWCAIRSANDYIALIYRADAKYFVLMCTARECSQIQTRMPIDPRDEINDIACQREGCVVASRTREGVAQLTSFTLRGKVAWKKPLAYATRDRIQLTAAGDRAYAMSLMTEEGPVVERILSKTGSIARAWHGAPGLSSPAIAWSKDYLMLAYWDGNALGHDVSAMPR